MPTLTNQKIQDTYQGLIKLDDNGTIDPTVLKQLTDGTGGSLPIQVSQVETKFQSLVDFTDATIVGISTAGLVAGTGPQSMASAATLTTTAAIASGDQSIAIGNEAEAVGAGTTAIGEGATATGNFSAAYGRDAIATSGVAIGNDSRASGSFQPIAIGYSTRASNVSSIAIGYLATALQPGAVAIGANVDANIAQTASVKALEVQTLDGGIILYSANGTGYKVTVTDGGLLTTTAI